MQTKGKHIARNRLIFHYANNRKDRNNRDDQNHGDDRNGRNDRNDALEADSVKPANCNFHYWTFGLMSHQRLCGEMHSWVLVK